MQHHFRAFSFVDRITRIEADGQVHGQYQIPAGIDAFPSSLASEALGQLAAWAAMEQVDFSHRPLAGIAGQVELLSTPQPGQSLDLEVHLESVDADSIVYSGLASANGQPVVRLSDCVGPMLPVEDFDNPNDVRQRFHLIRQQGAQPGAFQGLPEISPQPDPYTPNQPLHATLEVPPASSPFFADHFPRNPVFPGTLLVHANLQLAQHLANQLTPPHNQSSWHIQTISGVKLRSFTSPGTQLQLEATTTSLTPNSLTLQITTRNQRRTVCAATVEFTPHE
jgi:3-hydroxymyristoyl/3-hydroxydecanoyl-(acyl carrier protein) dehydratase